ncbi:thiamine-phosphate pyrophosphorylase/hydroxymethylpyrimidine kinase/phosphomethylpyrimidine kinase/thiamine-phosphate diphosphorylase [Stackebrandtia albiflava]|uniref:Thiamine-phosphate pyrophosphorylase/hydroxymethylpyrimidine kinase/phosphomethylpyrimidine kinase/thiamine-phosphate diphosphorylase n=1 Tax=Stackebrandtia albiflava TaxID=406432 RepID=A0A562UQY0_9ACTN|nr:thiamine phosphate synthase [Stackebrandtia albiflava]TWJ08020.1 thiamine-phosphate pyrophosphorylase/hydroxymethylpyrimidine kinase/phosphomethylpyrimidine kinase/thiamine-phosphate diphosphorylase [Stackebrandtia albiflava]
MALPGHRLLILTDMAQSPRPLVTQLAAAAGGGPFGVVVREKHLPVAERRDLTGHITEALAGSGCEVLVADPRWPVEACHLSVHRPVPTPRPRVVGRSAHAGDPPPGDVDYLTFSPVHASTSKPGYGPATGVVGLAAACRSTLLPVYALGGIETPERAERARHAGAHGVAVMGVIMRAPDPAATVRALRAAVG